MLWPLVLILLAVPVLLLGMISPWALRLGLKGVPNAAEEVMVARDIALAQLMKANYVDRVLTTNFDPLVMRACSLVGLYPATYDLAVSQHFEPDKVPDQAIFHLHGQRTGFILLSSEKAVKEHSDKLAPIFEDAGRGRVWLVVGYSGESDPVFNHLASVDQFDNKLYWIGYNDSEPAAHVREQLLEENKYAFYTMGFDADSFLVTLAQMLGCFPPEFVSKPFTYLGTLFDQMTAYTLPKTESPVDALRNAQRVVQEAIEKIESIRSDALQASSDLLGGDYEKVVGLETKYGSLWKREVDEPVAWAYIGKGNVLYNEAKTKSGMEKEELYKQASEKYEAALKIRPGYYEAFNDWGSELESWARTKTGVAADELFRQAGEKYVEAVKVMPDKREAFEDGGSTLILRHTVFFENKKNKLLIQAKEILLKAEESKEGSNSYNLARVCALNSEGDECLKWLIKSKERGDLPSRTHLEQDPDFANIRDRQWFKDFLKGVP